MAAGFLKSGDLGPHPHSYGGPHPHHSVPHGPLPPGMPMPSLGPFGLPHGLEAVGFSQGMWGKYRNNNFGICTNIIVQHVSKSDRSNVLKVWQNKMLETCVSFES